MDFFIVIQLFKGSERVYLSHVIHALVFLAEQEVDTHVEAGGSAAERDALFGQFAQRCVHAQEKAAALAMEVQQQTAHGSEVGDAVGHRGVKSLGGSDVGREAGFTPGVAAVDTGG